MSDINAVNSVLSDFSITSKQNKETKSNELGQSAFLELMITQLNNQDPLSPQDNGDFIAQLAQFSSVEGLERLNTSFDSFSDNFLSNQALQASSLVGRTVTVPSDKTVLASDKVVSGSFALPSSTPELSISVFNEAGALLQQIPLGPQTAGEKVFRWDGLNIEVNGDLIDWTADIPASEQPAALAPGTYRMVVNAMADGENTQLDTALSANVNSVTVAGGGGLILNLAGLGPVRLDDVKQFN